MTGWMGNGRMVSVGWFGMPWRTNYSCFLLHGAKFKCVTTDGLCHGRCLSNDVFDGTLEKKGLMTLNRPISSSWGSFQ